MLSRGIENYGSAILVGKFLFKVDDSSAMRDSKPIDTTSSRLDGMVYKVTFSELVNIDLIVVLSSKNLQLFR